MMGYCVDAPIALLPSIFLFKNVLSDATKSTGVKTFKQTTVDNKQN